MIKLEELESKMRVKGIVPNQTVELVAVEQSGPNSLSVAYRRADGGLGERVLYRADEATLSIPPDERLWPFDGDGRLLRLVSEAYRIQLGHLFDPLMAVHTSLIEPLPHQITAVYDEMLTRQPLRFLLADDPGAGKTIMAGLLIRELIVRGDARRCLICAPGNLTEQWQDELGSKFQLDFRILSRDMIEASRSGNPFAENDRLIVRLDQISRNEELQSRLAQTDWDLVVCDEAHKMSATYFGNELKPTKRYKLGALLGQLTRHLLLMTATPHNGKDDDFDLFMKLLDPDRFEGRARGGARRSDAGDLMRRMIKEKLLTFEGTPLFPERRATSVNYDLSSEELALYESVTEYVRTEFNRIDELEHGGRRSAIGFALTILQRRLASSPAAIYHSLRRRREKLETRLKEEQDRPEAELRPTVLNYDINLDDDLEDAPDSEVESIEAELVDRATAAETVTQLAEEIDILRELEQRALRVLHSGADSKWLQLLSLLQDTPELNSADGTARKLVIFTEHRDTLDYLTDRLHTVIGRPEAIVTIHGGTHRDQRRKIEADFRHDGDVQILVATDAAGEGINLQSAHLMVNYDLPWNPNRLEQRFGRIHRIGQKEVCHLWNLVAGETREGAVYQRLLEKLANERNRLNGQVFDVIGELFREAPLWKLMVKALRYGDAQEVRDRLKIEIDNATDQERVRKIVRDDLLVTGVMDTRKVEELRAEMERANARKLQPHFIKAFFVQAFQELGGALHERESGRYAINNVPAVIRNHALERGLGPISRKYARVCFHKGQIHQEKKPEAAFICPGHALLDATISLMLKQQRELLKRGAMLVAPDDPGDELRVLFYLEGAIQDAVASRGADSTIISRELHFVEIDGASEIREAGAAPYLDYRPATDSEGAQIAPLLGQDWLKGEQLEKRVTNYAIEYLTPRHLERLRGPRDERLDKTERAVQERLTLAISYCDRRAAHHRAQEAAGKVNARLNRQREEQRADSLKERLDQRKAQIALERQISATRPIVKGGALVIPAGMLLDERERRQLIDTRRSEAIAMRAVMKAERALGNMPKDVGSEKRGYDIESMPPAEQAKLRFIEVKGRKKGARDVTLTKNELHCALNSREQFILALVEIDGDDADEPRYVRGFPFRELEYYEESVKVNLRELLAASSAPG
ncbi:MAG: helicase-related protein [Chloroflexi bacterium]|nr:helicase-related protein [Chloroflexota bacterium]